MGRRVARENREGDDVEQGCRRMRDENDSLNEVADVCPFLRQILDSACWCGFVILALAKIFRVLWARVATWESTKLDADWLPERGRSV
jgi:hypothetical protein